MRYALILALLARSVIASPPTACGVAGAYEAALCAYQLRHFGEAEAGFRAIVDKGEADPQTLRSMYFLARTLMKTGRFEEAAGLLIRIYTVDRSYYESWSCDFLLGECRRAAGRG